MHTSLWLQWLLCVIVALNWLITLHMYSPDLAPSDYFLFPNMIKHLAGKQHRTDDEVIPEVEKDFFEDQDESFCTMGIQVLQHRWRWMKCVDRRGDRIDKISLTTFGQI